jgi:hypothetical protein
MGECYTCGVRDYIQNGWGDCGFCRRATWLLLDELPEPEMKGFAWRQCPRCPANHRTIYPLCTPCMYVAVKERSASERLIWSRQRRTENKVRKEKEWIAKGTQTLKEIRQWLRKPSHPRA